jgi:predicted nucleic acid-binding protein
LTRFFDTNVLVYAFLDVAKQSAAQTALALGGIISAQVLNEFTSVAHRKRQRPWPEIEAAVAVIRMQFPEVVPITAATHAAAMTLARAHLIGFYDALTVASAIEAGCGTLVTEDMQHGRRFGDLTVINPFIGV